MKTLLLMLFIFCSTPVFAQSERIQILDILEKQRLAWNDYDLEGYMKGYLKTDSLLFVGRSGPKYGWEVTLESYKKGYPDKAAMGKLFFDIKEVRLLEKEHAFVLGAWNVKREQDELKGWFTLILKKTSDGWRIIADHSS